jgi:hypothetical protein
VELHGAVTLGRDGTWIFQFADDVTINPGDTFAFTLRKLP